ncbi:MAG: ABC transporter permease [Lachnospiraceae bacterium]|nr:ABC transporter permease [Lachnospiraceae bacterium]
MKHKDIGKFILRRAVRLATLLIFLCILTFTLLELSPIDPVTAYVGADPSIGAEQRELIAQHWGLDKPPVERFFAWFSSIARGDWGTSMIYRRPVLEVIGTRFLTSLALMMTAWVLSGLFGFWLGIAAGTHEGKPVDRLIRLIANILNSTPAFWIGMLLIMVFSVALGWFPAALSVPIGVAQAEVTFSERISHLILPALALSITGIPGICLHTREKTCEVMHSDYVLFARARGESRGSIVRRHVCRNALLPALTLQFLSFSELFGGSVFVEQVFSYPGMGQAAVQAGLKGDAPLLMGIVIISMVFVFSGNLIADLLYRVVDPRMKEAGYE